MFGLNFVENWNSKIENQFGYWTGLLELSESYASPELLRTRLIACYWILPIKSILITESNEVKCSLPQTFDCSIFRPSQVPQLPWMSKASELGRQNKVTLDTVILFDELNENFKSINNYFCLTADFYQHIHKLLGKNPWVNSILTE